MRRPDSWIAVATAMTQPAPGHLELGADPHDRGRVGDSGRRPTTRPRRPPGGGGQPWWPGTARPAASAHHPAHAQQRHGGQRQAGLDERRSSPPPPRSAGRRGPVTCADVMPATVAGRRAHLRAPFAPPLRPLRWGRERGADPSASGGDARPHRTRPGSGTDLRGSSTVMSLHTLAATLADLTTVAAAAGAVAAARPGGAGRHVDRPG